MLDWIGDAIVALAEVVARLWQEDERPQARRFMMGCFGIVMLIMIAVLIWWFW